MVKNIKFSNQKIEVQSSWANLFENKIVNDCLINIESKIGTSYTPSKADVLRFLKGDLKKCKYVILGQDPYPQRGSATGRAFEVAGITNWEDTSNNASSRNILKLLHKNQTNSSSVQSIEKVRADIKNGNFKISPPNLLFKNWEKQGVLLLNTALTCEVGDTSVSNSHSNYWACFVQEIIDYIAKKHQKIIWLLWGKNAQSFGANISKNQKWQCYHPRLTSTKSRSFYSENHFSEAAEIDWCGNLI